MASPGPWYSVFVGRDGFLFKSTDTKYCSVLSVIRCMYYFDSEMCKRQTHMYWRLSYMEESSGLGPGVEGRGGIAQLVKMLALQA